MKVFHLSHTDLDGYGCQFVTRNIFEDIEFLNANYGEEVLVRIDYILSNLDIDKKNYILITDLNLTLKESEYLDKKVKELNSEGYNIELQLLDHHISGIDSAEKFSWYFLDISRSASKITYDFFSKDSDITFMQNLIDSINSVDIWLQNSIFFEFGKVLMRLTEEAKEINRYMFSKENVLYKHSLLNYAIDFIDKEDAHIQLDDNIYLLKKRYFMKDKKDTLDNLVTKYLVNLISSKKEKMTIYFEDKKGILTFGIQNSSIIGNGFLEANPTYHFFMNVNSSGTFSLRAKDKMDVSKMAYKIAQGGGHPNASGGKIKGFKEFFIYEELKSFIEQLLKEKSEKNV